MKKGDIIILAVSILLLAGVIAMFFLKPKAGYAAVYENGECIGRFSLNEEITEKIITKDGHYNILQITGGVVNVIEADCKNQVCVNTVPVSKIGDSIICLPHKLSIVLEEDKGK